MITISTSWPQRPLDSFFRLYRENVEVDICKGATWWQKNMSGCKSSRCFISSATELAVTSDQGVEPKVGLVHGDGFVWREQLLGQRQTNFDVVS